MRFLKPRTLIFLLLASLLFSIGIVCGYILNGGNLVRQFHVRYGRRAGHYSMQLGRGGNAVTLYITENPTTCVLDKLNVLQIGTVGSVCDRHSFSLFYQRKGKYGAPMVMLFTGTENHPHGWTDVGLRGRFLTTFARRGDTNVIKTLLNGKWVSGCSVRGNGTIQYKGVTYHYSRKSGNFQPINTGRQSQAVH